MRSSVPRGRPLFLTVPLHVVGLVILGVDVWGVAFWAAVGDSVGIGMVTVAVAVILGLGAMLAADARRQWLLRRPRAATGALEDSAEGLRENPEVQG
ncbi:hypothetical protein GGQ55_002131 [Geodermatophilus daqingensis]|uniref:Uncharacterized protein n=1 Tax=Petropleomorpha daqingensis TaxID=2026353 RepID=A0A853CIQ2_9ACTN|nr:hypothetical protein [Petropleomorpha daqingensis]